MCVHVVMHGHVHSWCLQRNFGRPVEWALVRDYPWSTPTLRKLEQPVRMYGCRTLGPRVPNHAVGVTLAEWGLHALVRDYPYLVSDCPCLAEWVLVRRARNNPEVDRVDAV